jgi:hypothetical protein
MEKSRRVASPSPAREEVYSNNNTAGTGRPLLRLSQALAAPTRFRARSASSSRGRP